MSEQREKVTLEVSEQDKNDIMTALRWYASDLEEIGSMTSRLIRIRDLIRRLCRVL